MTDCVFCKILAGEIPSEIIYQDEDVAVFPDINPVTPVHLLIIPKKHIENLEDMDGGDLIVGKMVQAARKVAAEKGLAERGYRLTINNGADAGQIVPHLHMHLMGGRELDWKH